MAPTLPPNASSAVSTLMATDFCVLNSLELQVSQHSPDLSQLSSVVGSDKQVQGTKLSHTVPTSGNNNLSVCQVLTIHFLFVCFLSLFLFSFMRYFRRRKKKQQLCGEGDCGQNVVKYFSMWISLGAHLNPAYFRRARVYTLDWIAFLCSAEKVCLHCASETSDGDGW